MSDGSGVEGDAEVARLRRELAEAEAAANEKAEAEARRKAVQDEVEQLKQQISQLKNQLDEDGTPSSLKSVEPEKSKPDVEASTSKPAVTPSRPSTAQTPSSSPQRNSAEVEKLKTQRTAFAVILAVAAIALIAVLTQTSSSNSSRSAGSSNAYSSSQSSNSSGSAESSKSTSGAASSQGMTSAQAVAATNACPKYGIILDRQTPDRNCVSLINRARNTSIGNGKCSYTKVKNWITREFWEITEWPITVDAQC